MVVGTSVKKILLTIFLISHLIDLRAQTCCSGGVPMASNIGLPASDVGTWQVSLNYDLNVLKTLKDGTDVLDDDTRKRITNTYLAQMGYSISNKFSADIFLSFVQQIRELTPIGQLANSDRTNGFGDAVLLIKYKFYKNFQFGIGVKAPFGASDKRNSNGIRLGADLQPGSGAWDLVYWLNGSQPLNFRRSMAVSATAIFRATGKNDNYLGSQVYEFGNEFQLIAGLSDRFVIGSKTIDPSFSLKYRKSEADKTNADNTKIKKVPSTGGEWVFIRPAVSLNLNKDISIQSSVELPIYANLVNTQVTPTYRINAGVFFSIRPKNKILQP